MHSISRAVVVQRRIERDLRVAGLDICPENIRWWARQPAPERRAWLGYDPVEGDDDHFTEHGYADGYPAVAS